MFVLDYTQDCDLRLVVVCRLVSKENVLVSAHALFVCLCLRKCAHMKTVRVSLCLRQAQSVLGKIHVCECLKKTDQLYHMHPCV